MLENRGRIHTRLKPVNLEDSAVDELLLVYILNQMGILFYLVFVGVGLTSAFLIQKALKAIKLI